MPEPFQKGNSREYVDEYERIFRNAPAREPDWEPVFNVFLKAIMRMDGGQKTYGAFNPASDTRDLLHEAQEELLDAINYLGMQYLKLEELKKRDFREKTEKPA